MKHSTCISASVALAGLFSAQAAFADLTADETWDAIVALAAQYGEELTGTPARDGDTLIIENVAFSYVVPEVSLSGTMGDLVFSENRNGTVDLSIAPEMPLNLSFDLPDEADEVTVEMLLRTRDYKTTFSGTPDALGYDYSTDEIVIDVTKVMADDESLDPDILVTLKDLAGTFKSTNGSDGTTLATTVTGGMGTVLASFVDPEEGGKFTLNLSLNGFESQSSTSIPEGAADVVFSDYAALAAAGVSGSGAFGTGDMALDLEIDAPDAKGMIDLAIGAITGDYTMGDATVGYEVAHKAMELSVSGFDIPFPKVTLQTEETAFGVTLPLAATEEPRDFRIMTAMRGVSVDDFLWGLFDPAGVLPRDPATLVIDLSGMGNWLVDIFDPQVAENLQGMPGEVHALNVDALELDIAGARLTGAGAFTFDNSDLVTFNGVPAPDGTLNLKLVGGNGLLDKLIQLGLIPQDQAMGVRMMSGLFARPGEGEDTLISEITVRKDGAVLANGQRLK